MPTQPQLSNFTLLLMISFASINAMLFTPALPEISIYFAISSATAELTMTWFLIGYAVGQLIYGPLANRYGRKPALYAGISLQIVSSFICIAAGLTHSFRLLILGRFMVALGSGVGLKMTFTLINETHHPIKASQKLSYIMLAFAITPAIGIAIGGLLTNWFGWISCFAAGIAYGIILLIAVTRLPETHINLHLDAFHIKKLIFNYKKQFTNKNLLAGAFLMGNTTSFVYMFAAVAPFVAMNFFDMSASEYGFANLLPSIGLILGSLTSAQLTKYFRLMSIVRLGIIIALIGVLLMLYSIWRHMDVYGVLFIPMMIIYYGLSLLMANVSSYVMSFIEDKSHGSAVMHFINMSIATISVIIIGLFHPQEILLPSAFLILCGSMILSATYISMKTQENEA